MYDNKKNPVTNHEPFILAPFLGSQANTIDGNSMLNFQAKIKMYQVVGLASWAFISF